MKIDFTHISELLTMNPQTRFIGCYQNGAAIASGDDYKQAFTSSLKTMQWLAEGIGDLEERAKGTPIQMFRYYPGDAGFLVLDLDRKNSKDGLAEIRESYNSRGLPLPVVFSDLLNGSYPCTVFTPSGGLHLYFRHIGAEYHKQNISPAIEVFHYGTPLTAPGSVKNGKQYYMAGAFSQALFLPGTIERLLKPYISETQRKPAFIAPNTNKTAPSLEWIAQKTIEDGEGASRNTLVFGIAKRASRYSAYTCEDVISFCQCYQRTTGHEQIETTVRSAFSHKGR